MPVVTPTSVDTTQDPQLHTTRNVTSLASRLLANTIVTPNVQDSIRTMRGLVADMKPDVFQAPKDNDTAIRQALTKAEKIHDIVVYIGDMANGLPTTDFDSGPVAQFQWQLQELYDFLQDQDNQLKLLLRRRYMTKLANQDEIGQRLSACKEELDDHLDKLQRLRFTLL
ncbi:hypothetical protein FRC09_000281 [Ceratobasidium sp. 395]|nr:hypothetical protein FRC09_000281 [Ceratobasidium sp. 395]